MWVRVALASLILAVPFQQASAQSAQPNIQILAQAYDRCMATQAVRLTHTQASDEEIFAAATQSCLSLDQQLRAGIAAQLPATQALQVVEAMDAQAKPNFMAMLARIRSDRARRAGS